VGPCVLTDNDSKHVCLQCWLQNWSDFMRLARRVYLAKWQYKLQQTSSPETLQNEITTHQNHGATELLKFSTHAAQ